MVGSHSRRAVRLVVGACSLLAAGCAPMREGAQVQSNLAKATETIAVACAQELTLNRALVQTLLQIDLEMRRRAFVEEIAVRYLDEAGRASEGRLDAALAKAQADPAAAPELALLVVQDQVARATALAAIDAVARALEIEDAAARAEALAQAVDGLAPLRSAREQGEALLAALDGRAARLAQVMASVAADQRALGELFDFSPDAGAVVGALAAQLWKEAVLERLEDPQKRAAAARALDRLLELAGLDGQAQTSQTTEERTR